MAGERKKTAGERANREFWSSLTRREATSKGAESGGRVEENGRRASE